MTKEQLDTYTEQALEILLSVAKDDHLRSDAGQRQQLVCIDAAKELFYAAHTARSPMF